MKESVRAIFFEEIGNEPVVAFASLRAITKLDSLRKIIHDKYKIIADFIREGSSRVENDRIRSLHLYRLHNTTIIM